MPQQVAVVQADARHDAQVRGDDVGAVQPAAQADFDDGDIHFLGLEPPERHGGRNLEERQVQGLEIRLPPQDEIQHEFFGNQMCSIPLPRRRLRHAHPLAEIQDVRRGIQAHLQSARGKGGSEQVRHRAFSVGPGDMDRPVGPVGIAQPVVEGPHPVQARLVGLPERCGLDRRKPLEQSVYFGGILLFEGHFI